MNRMLVSRGSCSSRLCTLSYEYPFSIKISVPCAHTDGNLRFVTDEAVDVGFGILLVVYLLPLLFCSCLNAGAMWSLCQVLSAKEFFSCFLSALNNYCWSRVQLKLTPSSIMTVYTCMV
jgi:hypothetical protein